MIYYFLIYKNVSKKYNLASKNYSNYFESFARALGDAFGVIQQLKFADNNYFKKKDPKIHLRYIEMPIYNKIFGMLPSYVIEAVAYGTILIINLFYSFSQIN